MKNILRIELSRAFKNKLFLVAVAMGSSIIIWHFVQNALPWLFNFDETVAEAIQYDPMFSPGMLFAYWIGGNASKVQSFLFYLLIPILATIPFADSFFLDRKTGFIKNVLVRGQKKYYFLSKFIATFLAGGSAVLIPLVLSLALTAMVFPAMDPEASTYVFAINASSLWGSLFYTHPFIYVFLYLIITFIFCGFLATTALVMGFFAENRFVVIVTPFLLYLFTFSVFSLFGADRFEPINFLSPSFGGSSLSIILGETLLLGLVTLILFIWKGLKDDTY